MRRECSTKQAIWKVISFVVVFVALLCMDSIKARAAGTQTVYIHGYKLSVSSSSPTAYYINGGTEGSESDYNAKLEYGEDESILTLNGLNVGLSNNNGIDVSGGDFKIVLNGDNIIQDNDSYSSYLIFKAWGSEVTIGGDGSLTLVDEVCATSRIVNVNKLYLTDSASLILDIGKATYSSNGVYVSNGFEMDKNASLNITVDNCTRDYDGIEVTNSGYPITVKDNADLDITLVNGSGYANSTLYGIYSAGPITMSTSKDVDIKIGTNYNNYGIYTTGDVTVNGTCINIDLEDAGNNSQGMSGGALTMGNGAAINVTTSIINANYASNGTNGTEYGLSVKDVEMSAASSIDVKTGDANQIWGIKAYNIEMSEDSSIDIQCGNSINQINGVAVGGAISAESSSITVKTKTGGDVYGVNTGTLSLMGDSTVITNVTGVWDSQPNAAVGVQATTAISMYDESTMDNTVYGSNILNAMGVRAVTFYIEDEASCDVEVDGAKFFCAGINADNFNAAGTSKVQIHTGDITPSSVTGTLACGIYAPTSSIVQGVAKVTIVSGTGEAGFGVYGPSCAINDIAYLEVTSDMNAFQIAPTLDVPANYYVKTGASSATAILKDNTEKQTAATYTDNKYVLVHAFYEMADIAITDVEVPVAYGEFDMVADCDTTGIEKTVVVWKLDGAPKQDVEPNKEYTVEIRIYPDEEYELSSDTDVTINGNEAITMVLNSDGTITATYKMTAVDVKLVAVENPDAITEVANGTAIADIELPSKVMIETENGSMEVDVVWNTANPYSGSYDSESTDAQTFTLQGTVTLPEGVDANGVSLQVYICLLYTSPSPRD